MLTKDIRVDFLINIGVDIIFNLDGEGGNISDSLGDGIADSLGNKINTDSTTSGFDPARGDYYTVLDGIATLHRGDGSDTLTDNLGNSITDNLNNPISII